MASFDADARFSQNQAGYTTLTPALEGELVTGSALLSGAIDRLAASDTGAGRPVFFAAEVAYGALGAVPFNPGTSANFQVIGSNIAPGAFNTLVRCNR